MKFIKSNRTKLAVALITLGLPLFFVNMQAVAPTTITYSQLSSVNATTKLCTVRPSTAGLVYYNAMISKRSVTGQGLNDSELLSHAATRLGFGLSPFGPIVADKANDCITVFLAEEIVRQLGLIGSNVDSAQVTRIRQGYLPLSFYPRADLDKAMWRFQNDPTDVSVIVPPATGTAHGALWYRARQEIYLLMNLRNIMGSQAVLADGSLVDHQINLQDAIGEFWVNHFNVDGSKAEQYYSGSDSMVEGMRTKFGGTFYSLLSQVMNHPAMLVYLDNKDNHYVCQTVNGVSKCAASNQNLGRELMELHTFGVGPSAANTTSPYTQLDVVAMADILAGYNVVPYNASTNPGSFIYNSTLAANVPVSLMGVSYAATGQPRLGTVLKMLANHAQTKQNICGRLAEHFFAAAATTVAKNACVAAWGTDGALTTMYAAMFKLPEFWSKANYRNLYRTPIEIPIAAARGIGLNIVDFKFKVVADKLSNTAYVPANMTPLSFITAHDAMKKTSGWWTFYSIAVHIKNLLGVHRGEIALPIGYEHLGFEHLSSTYVDETSRTAFNVVATLEGMDKTTRIDIASNAVNSLLETKLAASGGPVTQQYFLDQFANTGKIASFATSSVTVPPPYTLPPSQQTIISTVVANRASWPYDINSSTNKKIEKALSTLAFGHAEQMKK